MRGSAASRERRVLTFAFITVFLDLVGFGLIIPLLPLYVKSMGGSAVTVGFILSSFAVTQLLATPILGRLSDRVGRRRVILISLAGNALSMALFALATELSTLPLLFASRIMAGATAGNISACQAAVADVTRPEDRAKGMGRIGAGIGLGMVLGPVIGSSVSHLGPWAPPLFASALAVADLVGAFFFMPETKATGTSSPAAASAAAATASAAAAAHGAAKRATLWEALTNRGILKVFALYFLTFLYMSTINVTLPLLTNARLGWTEREIGHVFGLFGFMMFVIQGGLIGRLTRAWGPRNLVLAGSFASMCGLLLVSRATTAAMVAGGLLLLGIGMGVINPCLSSLASEHAGPERQGSILGFAQSAGGLARAIGPTLTGIVYTHVGIAAPFAAGACVALVSVVLAFTLTRPSAAPASPSGGYRAKSE
ncbi:MFS transporter [Pendulispora albinea]|uniref:MFS transporter n=1 Tax=Pendulispora albinea TaxID=2741071 RepID=A0ABZ2M9U4_9BACT